jgi:hypothetical protein
MHRPRAGIAVVLAFVVVSGVVALAQRFGVFEGAGAGIRVPPRDFHDGGFTVCKWMFRSDRSEPSGIGWSTDYPFGEINLLTRIAEFMNVRVRAGERQSPPKLPRHRRWPQAHHGAMTHNTDIGDSMEREGDDPAYFAAFSPDGYALATNIVLYALTH